MEGDTHKNNNNNEDDDEASEIFFEDLVIKITSSEIRQDSKKKSYTVYIISVRSGGVERWHLEKRYSDFYILDEKVIFDFFIFFKKNIKYSILKNNSLFSSKENVHLKFQR